MRPMVGSLLAGCILSGAAGAAARLHAQDDPLRGGTFELGAVVGRGGFQGRSRLEPCTWAGIRAGHRFAPFAGNERLQLGFRAGWEGCLTEHKEGGRIDLIYLNASWLFAYRVSGSWLLYWGTGMGMLLGDSTPGPGDEVEARFSGNVGPGFTWAVGRHFLIDVSLFSVFYEGFELGPSPSAGTTFGMVPSLMLAVQI